MTAEYSIDHSIDHPVDHPKESPSEQPLEYPLGMIIVPVDNLDKALTFYSDTLGMKVKFRDENRFCSLTSGKITLGLAAREERITDHPTLAFHTDDLHLALDQLISQGANQGNSITLDENANRCALTDPDGNQFIIYQSNSSNH